MQVNQPSGSAGEATTTNIKRYIVSEQFGDRKVTLEADHNVLTSEVAMMINEFWSCSADRLAEERGDVVRTVVRLFGQRMIGAMLAQGGAVFSERYRSPFGDENPGGLWTADIHNEEGWGGSANGSPFGFCGIRCVAADVASIDFDDLQVEEVSRG